MPQEKEDFNEYINYFKTLSLKEKKSIIYEQMKILAGFTNNLCNELNVKNELLINKELLDLNNENYSQDDFAEAIIVLLNSIQNSICDATVAIADFADRME